MTSIHDFGLRHVIPEHIYEQNNLSWYRCVCVIATLFRKLSAPSPFYKFRLWLPIMISRYLAFTSSYASMARCLMKHTKQKLFTHAIKIIPFARSDSRRSKIWGMPSLFNYRIPEQPLHYLYTNLTISSHMQETPNALLHFMVTIPWDPVLHITFDVIHSPKYAGWKSSEVNGRSSTELSPQLSGLSCYKPQWWMKQLSN
jgi:hypothetical protein